MANWQWLTTKYQLLSLRLCLSSTVIRGGKSQYWRKLSLNSVSELLHNGSGPSKFSHRFTCDFTNTDKKKINNALYLIWKYFLTENPLGFNLEPSWSNSKWVFFFFFFSWIPFSCMQRSRKWVLPHWFRLFYLTPLKVRKRLDIAPPVPIIYNFLMKTKRAVF